MLRPYPHYPAMVLGWILLGIFSIAPVSESRADNPFIPQAVASASATGEFEFDEARLTFSVSNEGQNAADLAGKLSKVATGLVAAMKSAGLSDADLRITGPAISVRYAMIRDTNGNQTIDRQRLDGYSGFISLTARFTDFTKLGKAISDGIRLGAAVNGPNYALAKSDEKEALLAIDATKQALLNAKAMIEASGRKPGRVLSIESDVRGQPVFEGQMRALAVAAPSADINVPINPGRATLSKSVTVKVEILEP